MMGRHGICALLLILVGSLCGPAKAGGIGDLLNGNAAGQSAPAFSVMMYQEAAQLHVDIQIAPAAKLYRDRVTLHADDVRLGEVVLPSGVDYQDPEFGVVQVFHDALSFTVPVLQGQVGDTVVLHYQGCTEGFCYPPEQSAFTLTEAVSTSATTMSSPMPAAPDTDDVAFFERSVLEAVLIALLLGAGLALTPCVFPMYPILSAVVMSGHRSAWQSFCLCMAYIQGMALIYAALGLVVAMVGLKVQVALQHPAVLVGIAAMFVMLAVSMFGGFTLSLPQRYLSPLNNLNQSIRGGTLSGAFAIGALSALVASPCTTAPLAGVLMYIAHSGDTVKGFVMLYALACGMGVPLLIFGMAGGKIMPKAGAWMSVVKHGFGFLSLGMAIYFCARFVDETVVTALYLALALSVMGYVQYQREGVVHRGVRSVLALVVIIGITGVGIVAYEGVYAPEKGKAQQASALPFIQISSQQELDRVLSDAQQDGRKVMLDLYASWCSACISYEKKVFSDPAVHRALKGVTLIQIDMSQNSAANTAMQSSLGVVGLPTILFFDGQHEDPGARVTGLMSAGQFARHTAAFSGR